MSQISCRGRDGIVRDFEYRVEHNRTDGQWTYRVTTIPPPAGGDFFELRVVELDESAVRVVMANHFYKEEYSAMGIPEALLPVVKAELGRAVESSPSQGPVAGIYRADSATKYWERLCKLGGATYDSSTDIFTVA